jgi:hypothetical protein
MQTDTYTKIVLTVIAACLLWSNLATPHTTAKAQAQDAQRIVIAGVDIPRKHSGGLPIYFSLPRSSSRTSPKTAS